MTLAQLLEHIRENPHLQVCGLLDETLAPAQDPEKARYLAIDNTKRGFGCRIDLQRLREDRAEDVFAVLEGREELVLRRLTRIVGYYSDIKNWSPSKLRELKERRRGRYEVEAQGGPETGDNERSVVAPASFPPPCATGGEQCAALYTARDAGDSSRSSRVTEDTTC